MSIHRKYFEMFILFFGIHSMLNSVCFLQEEKNIKAIFIQKCFHISAIVSMKSKKGNKRINTRIRWANIFRNKFIYYIKMDVCAVVLFSFCLPFLSLLLSFCGDLCNACVIVVTGICLISGACINRILLRCGYCNDVWIVVCKHCWNDD